jgi:hypothetical protein
MAHETRPRSTLAMLREQVPPRPLTGYEVRQVLDRQATRLLKLSETFGPPVPVETTRRHCLASWLSGSRDCRPQEGHSGTVRPGCCWSTPKSRRCASATAWRMSWAMSSGTRCRRKAARHEPQRGE